MILLLLLALVASSLADPPIRIRITESGVRRILESSPNLVGNYLNSTKFFYGNNEIEITNGRLTSYNTPDFQVKMTDNSIIITTSRGTVGIEANWKADLQNSTSEKSDISGTLKISSNSINLHVELFPQQLNGKPSFVAINCTGNMDLQTEIAGLENGETASSVKATINDAVQKMAEKELCYAFSEATNDFNVLIQDIELSHAFGANGTYNMTGVFSGPILTTSEYWQLDFNVIIDMGKDIRDECIVEHTPNEKQNWKVFDDRITIWVSPQVLQCFMGLLQEQQALEFQVPPASISNNSFPLPPQLNYDLFQTSCVNDPCYGSEIPDLGNKYPNRSIILAYKSIDMPRISLPDSTYTTKHLTLNTTFSVDMLVEGEENPVYSFDLYDVIEVEIARYARQISGAANGSSRKILFPVLTRRFGREYSTGAYLKRNFGMYFKTVELSPANIGTSFANYILGEGILLPIFGNSKPYAEMQIDEISSTGDYLRFTISIAKI